MSVAQTWSPFSRAGLPHPPASGSATNVGKMFSEDQYHLSRAARTSQPFFPLYRDSQRHSTVHVAAYYDLCNAFESFLSAETYSCPIWNQLRSMTAKILRVHNSASYSTSSGLPTSNRQIMSLRLVQAGAAWQSRPCEHQLFGDH